MKTIILNICVLLLLTIHGTTSSSSNNSHWKTSFVVHSSDIFYELIASYDQNVDDAVRIQLNDYLKLTLILKEPYELDKTVELADHSKIYIKTSPGELKIRLEKHQNSKAALSRLEAVSKKLRKVIMEP